MAINITYWLRKTPQPVAVLCDDKRIEVPKNGRAWRDLTATIKSLEPSKLTCLDGQGNVIRAVVIEAEDDKPAPSSPEMSDLQLFARLLSEGYEKGMRANQPIVDSAMAFVEQQSTRLARAESEIDRLRAQNAKLTLQISELSGAAPAGDDSLLGTIMAGIQASTLAQNPLAVVKQQPAVKK